jgi:hypothetical protein
LHNDHHVRACAKLKASAIGWNAPVAAARTEFYRPAPVSVVH